jgi:small-conductance mechanosensitive channel
MENYLPKLYELFADYGVQILAAIAVFIARPWVNSSYYWSVYWETTEKVKKQFDADGISIPFPQRDIHVYEHKQE